MSDQVATKASKGRGCFFYGCLTLIVVMLLGAAGIFFGVRYGLNKLNALIVQYTDTQPLPLPTVELPPAEYEALQARVRAFGQAIEAKTPTPPLTLTADEINALIAHHPEMKPWKDRVYISLDGEQVKAQVSLPLAALAQVPGFSPLQGRYLNGEAVLAGGLENQQLAVRMQSLVIKGKPVPEEFMQQIRKENLTAEAHRDGKQSEFLSKLQSIEVKDGKIIIQAN